MYAPRGARSEEETESEPNIIHILNAPSPGATASLLIGEEIAGIAERAWLGG